MSGEAPKIAIESAEVEPVTARKAAELMERAPGTIYSWVTRYGARRVGKVGGKVYYDYGDLVVIDREIRHRHPVPATPEARTRVRAGCPLTPPG